MPVSTTQDYGRFKMPLATRNREVEIRVPGTYQYLDIPADAAAAEKMQKALLWAVANHGQNFTLPSVETFSGVGEKALETVEQGQFRKAVLKHPFDGNK
jgi:hypothetical protein